MINSGVGLRFGTAADFVAETVLFISLGDSACNWAIHVRFVDSRQGAVSRTRKFSQMKMQGYSAEEVQSFYRFLIVS
jgi:hypothetical protein